MSTGELQSATVGLYVFILWVGILIALSAIQSIYNIYNTEGITWWISVFTISLFIAPLIISIGYLIYLSVRILIVGK